MTQDLDKKHILFCAAGMSPAIITETLFGLYKEGVKNGEIHVVTTTQGKEGIETKLLGESNKINQFNQHYGTDWRLKPEWIEIITDKDDKPLDDLRTTADNMALANTIMQKVRKWTDNDDIILHASLAGGRKTMGFYLGQAMSWFARPQDDLSHVLIPPDLENPKSEPPFFYPFPDQKELQQQIDYAPQTFVRLRGFMPDQLVNDEDLTYENAAQLFQAFLRDHVGKAEITLDLNNGDLLLDGCWIVHLPPLPMALYLFLLEHANKAKEQEPFDILRHAYDYRKQLADCLRRCNLKPKKPEGLSILGYPESDWPEHWIKEGDISGFSEQRKEELGYVFTRLKRAFKDSGLSQRSFSLQMLDERKSSTSTRWVDIDPERLKIIEE